MFQILRNPTMSPEGDVESYGRQNVNSSAVRVGLDSTNPFDNGTTITVPVGGVVEVNGMLYRITQQITVNKPNPALAYWIVVVPSADQSTATLQAVVRPGPWNPQRQGCYFTSGTHNNRRTLNWVSRGTLSNIPAGATGRVYNRETKINADTTSLQKGWHFVRLESGAGGGDGANGGMGTGGGIGVGGVANISLSAETIFFADKPHYHIKVGGSGRNGMQGASIGSGSNTLRGGGGGGGSGEESVFDGLSTGMVPPGNGGNGGGTSNNIGGGGRNGSDGSFAAPATPLEGADFGLSSLRRGGRGGLFWGGGGGGASAVGGISGAVAGGNGGDGGQSQPDGAAGGSCNIFLLGN